MRLSVSIDTCGTTDDVSLSTSTIGAFQHYQYRVAKFIIGSIYLLYFINILEEHISCSSFVNDHHIADAILDLTASSLTPAGEWSPSEANW